MRAAIYARVSTDRQERDQTIDSQLDGPAAVGRRPRPRPPARARLHRRGLLRRPARPPRPSTASATPPARASSTSSPSTAPTGWPAGTPTRSSSWRSSARPAATSSSSSGRSPTTRTTSSCSRSRGPSPSTSGPSSASGSAAASSRRPGPGSGSPARPPTATATSPSGTACPAHLVVDEAEAEVVRMLYRWLIDERMTVRQILKRLAAGPWRPRSGKRLWSNVRRPPHPLRPGLHRHGLRQPVRVRRAPQAPVARAPGGHGRPAASRGRARSGSRSRSRPSSTRRPISRRAAQLARNSALSFRNNTRNDYLLRCLLTCRTCGLAMFGVTTTGGRRAAVAPLLQVPRQGHRGAGTATCRCPQTPGQGRGARRGRLGPRQAAARRPGHAARPVRGAGPAGRRRAGDGAGRGPEVRRPSCGGSTARSSGCSTPTRPRPSTWTS